MKIGDPSAIKPQMPNVQSGSDGRPANPNNQNLENSIVGRLLKGRVLSLDVGGKVLLSVGGKNIAAQTFVPLQPGQEVWLEVVKEGDLPILGSAAKKGAVIDLMKQLFTLSRGGSSATQLGGDLVKASASVFTDNTDLAAPLKKFIKLFAEGIQGGAPDSGKILKQLSLLGLFTGSHRKEGFIQEGGQKQLVADLIALISGKEASELLKSIGGVKGISELVRLFETLGQLNSPSAGQEQPDFMLLPCFFAGNSGWGEWFFNFVGQGETGEGDNKQFSITFFLEMSNLGELSLQLLVNEKIMQGVFSVSDQKALQYLETKLPELSESLMNLGYKQVNLSCQLENVHNLQKLKETLGQQVGPETFALLDVTI